MMKSTVISIASVLLLLSSSISFAEKTKTQTCPSAAKLTGDVQKDIVRDINFPANQLLLMKGNYVLATHQVKNCQGHIDPAMLERGSTIQFVRVELDSKYQHLVDNSQRTNVDGVITEVVVLTASQPDS